MSAQKEKKVATPTTSVLKLETSVSKSSKHVHSATCGHGAEDDAMAPEDKEGVVYIGHIPHGFYEKQMKEYFTQFGTVKHMYLSRSRKTGKSRGYAFVQFDNATDAKIVAEVMNGYPLMEKVIKAEIVDPEKVHPSMFRYADKKWKKIPWRTVIRDIQMRPKTDEQAARRMEKLVAREKAQAQKLVEAGIDYDFPMTYAGMAVELGLMEADEDVDEEEAPSAAAASKSLPPSLKPVTVVPASKSTPQAKAVVKAAGGKEVGLDSATVRKLAAEALQSSQKGKTASPAPAAPGAAGAASSASKAKAMATPNGVSPLGAAAVPTGLKRKREEVEAAAAKPSVKAAGKANPAMGKASPASRLAADDDGGDASASSSASAARKKKRVSFEGDNRSGEKGKAALPQGRPLPANAGVSMGSGGTGKQSAAGRAKSPSTRPLMQGRK